MVDFAKMLADKLARQAEIPSQSWAGVSERQVQEELPEVTYVVESAIAKFLRNARENQAKLEKAQIQQQLTVAEKIPAWVEGPRTDSTILPADEGNEESLESESFSEMQESEQESYDDYDSQDAEQAVGQEEQPTLSKSRRLAIPDEAHSGLRNPEITLDESQVAAIEALMDKQYSCLIGPAGTGKTTCTKEVIHKLIYDEDSNFELKRAGNKFNVGFVAFTGMAVQVLKGMLPSWLHDSCKTIHMLLEYAPVESIVIDKKTGQPKVSMVFKPRKHEEDKLFEDLLIIDESSMLGMELWDNFRRACKPGTKIIMIGDLNQLPPIIGEPIFAYALGKWHVSELTHVHRQKGSAGKIVEMAHYILNGDYNSFAKSWDSESQNPDWRVIGSKLDPKASKAATTILSAANYMRHKKFPDGTPIYDPFRDRIMTAGNGYGVNGETEGDFVQQAPLNDAMALMIQPSSIETPRYIIDAGRAQRHFAVGNRVMATKNESPANVDRVTNGMTGIIKSIIPNNDYMGDKNRVGPEHEIRANIRKAFGLEVDSGFRSAGDDLQMSDLHMGDLDMDALSDDLAERLSNSDSDESASKANSQNWASHTVIVEFVNGATREFWSKQQVESLQLAYASTVAKCQGSQFPTAVIVVHHAQRQALCREWLYTAVTRAQEHVIILYTEYALRYCFGKQKIKGSTLKEKIARYMELYEGVESPMGGVMRRNITLTVGGDEADDYLED